MHRFDLLIYYIDNFGDEIEEVEDKNVKNRLKSFTETKNNDDDEENKYKILNVECLIDVVSSLNLKLLKILIPKIVFILKNCQYQDLSTYLTST